MKTATRNEPRKQPDVTRERLVDAAFDEIHRHGFQAASLANILARTGLTKGALYHHFPTKDDLGYAVVEEIVHGRLNHGFFKPLREADDPIRALRAILDKRAESATSESVKLGCPLNNLMQEMSPLDPEFKRRLNATLTDWQDAVAEALVRARKKGQLRKDVDCRAAALFIVSAFEGCVGIAKNMQSVKEFRQCLAQLDGYVQGLLQKG